MKSIDIIIKVELDSLRPHNYKEKGENPCLICGKDIKGNYKKVQLLTSGYIVSSSEVFEDSQGFFPVGSDCAKRLVVNFAF